LFIDEIGIDALSHLDAECGRFLSRAPKGRRWQVDQIQVRLSIIAAQTRDGRRGCRVGKKFRSGLTGITDPGYKLASG
jgi:Uri superfamily endonuclease